MFIIKDTRGVAALMAVIIIGAAVLIMAYSASLLGMGELDMGYISQRGLETAALADGCLDEALFRLRLDENFTGNTLNFSNGSCMISVTVNDNNRIVIVSSTVDKYYKASKTEVAISSSTVQIVSWEELSL